MLGCAALYGDQKIGNLTHLSPDLSVNWDTQDIDTNLINNLICYACVAAKRGLDALKR
jgi:hypothetical protein